jgi:transcription elongation factor GreA
VAKESSATAAAMSLAEAAAKYVSTLNQAKGQEEQPSVYRFVQWLGADRPLANVRTVDVERFVEESAGRGGSQGRNIDSVRRFLAYLKKAGLTESNLSTAIKLKKTDSDTSAYVDPDAVQMTREGYEALQRELEQLINKRPQIADALRLAMADKDFRENAPLDAARDQQAHVEAQIRRIEQLVKHAEIVDRAPGKGGSARVGSLVSVLNLQTNQQLQYQLVSPSEVNPREGKISVASPVGKALVDCVTGDEVSVNVPAGTVRLRIEAIESK